MALAVLSDKSIRASPPPADGDNVALTFPLDQEMCGHCGTKYRVEEHEVHFQGCRVLARERWLLSLQPIVVRYNTGAGK